MPISKFQSDVLRLLAAQCSPDSYLAGGIAINRQGPRFSGDIDIFHDSTARQDGDKPVHPDVAALDRYQRNPGAPVGLWPSSPDITRAMLERYGKTEP